MLKSIFNDFGRCATTMRFFLSIVANKEVVFVQIMSERKFPFELITVQKL